MDNIESLIHSAIDKIQRNANSPDYIPGLRSGYVELDRITGGFEGPDLIVIGARPLMGKTTLIINIMLKMARDYNIPAMFYSLDMSANQLVNRLLSSVSGVENIRMREGCLTADEWGQLMSASSSLTNIPLLVSDQSFTIEDLCDNAEEMVEKYGVKIIFIDYLQLLSPKENKENRYQDVAFCTRKLKELAKTLNIPIVVTSQVNRSPELRPGRTNVFCKPEMYELRDSGTICEDANIVILLDRPELTSRYEPDYDEYDNRGIVNVIIAKNNNGREDMVRLRFKGECNRIEEIEPDNDQRLSGIDMSEGNYTTFISDSPESPF